MLTACIGMVPPKLIEQRLAVVRAQICQMREATQPNGAVITDTPHISQLIDEAAFLEVLAS
jgi:hypothetical protein